MFSGVRFLLGYGFNILFFKNEMLQSRWVVLMHDMCIDDVYFLCCGIGIIPVDIVNDYHSSTMIITPSTIVVMSYLKPVTSFVYFKNERKK